MKGPHQKTNRTHQKGSHIKQHRKECTMKSSEKLEYFSVQNIKP